jgi:hypothetical protein
VSAALSMDNAIDTLHKILAASFDGPLGGKQLPPRHRDRYARAIHFVAEFLAVTGADPKHVDNMLDLSMGFVELRRGIVRPYFKPERTGHSPDGSDVWMGRQWVATLYHLLLRSGWSAKEAVGIIGTEKEALKNLPGKKARSIPVLSWYEQLRRGASGKVKNELALRIFESNIEAIDASGSTRPKEFVRDQVKRILRRGDFTTIAG